MKKRFIFLLLALISNYAFSQTFLTDTVSWNQYEINYSKKLKLEKIKKIKDELIEYLESNDELQNNLHNFHFFDYNSDGNIDIIYTGDAGTDSERTLIFVRDDDGDYVKKFDKFGSVVNLSSAIYQNTPPYTFVLKEVECCGGTSIVYEAYQPVNENGSFKLNLLIKYSTIKGTKFPDIYFNKKLLFRVTSDIYNLRLNPTIDSVTNYVGLHIRGNVVAEYSKGAEGYAIAQTKDKTGRIWWFVIMLNNNKPTQSIFDGGDNDDYKFYSLGWMSSKYLEKLE
jgi:hypothetical protein